MKNLLTLPGFLKGDPDQGIVIGNDRREHIKHDRHLRVGNDRAEEIRNDHLKSQRTDAVSRQIIKSISSALLRPPLPLGQPA